MIKVTRNDDVMPPPASKEGPVAASDGSYVITDSKGRKLKIVEPDILSESRLVRALGDASSNAAYMSSYVLPAAMVVEIDGTPVPFPMTEREVDAAIQSLGRHGLIALMNHFVAVAKKSNSETDGIKK